MKFKDIDQVARNCITRGIRDGFKRSEYYKGIKMLAREEKPRYKKDGTRAKKDEVWYTCAACEVLHKEKDIQVDHVEPVQPLGVLLVDMEIGEYAERTFEGTCQVLCKECHSSKSNIENAERRKLKKSRLV